MENQKNQTYVVCARIPISTFEILREKSARFDISIGAVIRECIIHSCELDDNERKQMSAYKSRHRIAQGVKENGTDKS